MRGPIAVASFLVFGLLAACGGNPGFSICENQVPPPEACMTSCDPAPGAPNTCPSGFHCSPDGKCDARCTQGGGECGDGYRCTPDGRCVGENECVNLECNVVDCNAMGMPDTSLSGKVFAPNGTLPLYGVNVYVPNDASFPLPAFPEGAQCSRCIDGLPGSPIASAITDDQGNFTIYNLPSGTNIPLVITIGKWRRQITIPVVNQCTSNTLGAAETRLPKNKSEGELPKIAVTTGDADSMECLARKLGIEDSEITPSTGAGRIHLYGGNGVGKLKAGFAGGSGQNLTGAEPFWNSIDTLKSYDIVILSCEGAQLQGATNKTQGALDAMKAYADLGGRVFASHWHNIWISGKFQNGVGAPTPAVWNTIGTWQDVANLNTATDVIDEINNPKGPAFSNWMVNVGASTTRGQFPVTQPRITNTSLDLARSERWVYLPPGAQNAAQMFQFTTPNETSPDQRCGKVVFTDMHVSGSRVQNQDYPDSCVGGANNLTLSPQEKALAFMFFDIASCVGAVF
ncbi:MAG: carboxypeptidase regulatory-like domain-containing protein [Deltaproteobacteria bacterium]|nr:carboxypeptidase regulatory-like domain-containing protein [Deltaproteobacteria bacterium]MCW5802431.1 carboxypeptidase regulatory-like domain-containing protein [Deltaproteobacteria bacterium]